MLLLRHDRSVVEIMASVITAVTLAGLRAVIIGLTSLAVPDNFNHPGSTANTFILTVPFGKICQGHKQDFFDKFISSLFLS